MQIELTRSEKENQKDKSSKGIKKVTSKYANKLSNRINQLNK